MKGDWIFNFNDEVVAATVSIISVTNHHLRLSISKENCKGRLPEIFLPRNEEKRREGVSSFIPNHEYRV